MIGSVEVGHPAADVRDFLRRFEKRAMLLERFRGAHRLADVAKARDDPDHLRTDAVRRDVALEHAAVREADDVQDLPFGVGPEPPRRLEHRLDVFDLRRQRLDDAVEPAALDRFPDQAEHLQILAVVEEHPTVEIDDQDPVVRRFQRFLEERDGFFRRGTVVHGSLRRV